jgi:hypothetical protein
MPLLPSPKKTKTLMFALASLGIDFLAVSELQIFFNQWSDPWALSAVTVCAFSNAIRVGGDEKPQVFRQS